MTHTQHLDCQGNPLIIPYHDNNVAHFVDRVA